MIHAPRPLQGGRWLFKRVFRGEDSLQNVSPSASGTPFLSCSNCKLSPLPAERSLTLDVSKIPNALPILPSIASNGKEKTRGHKRRPVTHTLPSAGYVAGTPAGGYLSGSISIPIPQAHSPAALRPPPGDRRAQSRFLGEGCVQGLKHETPTLRRRPQRGTYREAARQPVLLGVWPPGTSAAVVRSAQGCPVECPPLGPG